MFHLIHYWRSMRAADRRILAERARSEAGHATVRTTDDRSPSPFPVAAERDARADGPDLLQSPAA